jgi:hypothetical protein
MYNLHQHFKNDIDSTDVVENDYTYIKLSFIEKNIERKIVKQQINRLRLYAVYLVLQKLSEVTSNTVWNKMIYI